MPSTTINDERNDIELEEGHVFDENQDFPARRMRLASFIDRFGNETEKTLGRSRFRQVLHRYRSALSCINMLNFLFDRLPIIRCLKEYKIRKYIFGDIIAGITVAIMHIPQGFQLKLISFFIELKSYSIEIFCFSSSSGMAYGVLTTLPPVYGRERFVIV